MAEADRGPPTDGDREDREFGEGYVTQPEGVTLTAPIKGDTTLPHILLNLPDHPPHSYSVVPKCSPDYLLSRSHLFKFSIPFPVLPHLSDRDGGFSLTTSMVDKHARKSKHGTILFEPFIVYRIHR